MKADNKLIGSLEPALALLKREGLKLTPQRLEIYRELMGARDHPSAEDIYRRVSPRLPTVSLDTVYRTLEMFERMGIASRVEVLDDRSRYEPDAEPHHHFVCVACKKIVDFPWPAVEKMNPPQDVKRYGKVISRHLELRGVCSACQKKGGGEAGGRPGG